MDMSGSQRIEASRAKVYAALNDVDVLRQCIPGCDSIEKTSDTEMDAKVTLRIGPVKATFTGKVTLSDFDPPNGYKISGEGSGGMAGFANGGAAVVLAADGAATILNYTVNADIGGKIAQLGGRLIDGTAKKLAADFFEKFSEIVSAPGVIEETPPIEVSNDKGWVGNVVDAIKNLLTRVLGLSSAAALIVILSANACCVNGHRHEADDIYRMPICSSQSPRI